MKRLVEGGLVQTLTFDKSAGVGAALSFFGITPSVAGSCTIAQNAAAKRRGNYGLQLAWDGVNAGCYMYQSVGALNDFYFRFYFKLDPSFVIPDSGGGQGIFLGCIMDAGANGLVDVYIDRNGSAYELNFQYGGWGGWGVPTGAARVAVSKNAWHSFEFHLKVHASAGGAEAWLDDALLWSDFSKDSSAIVPTQWLIGSDFTAVIPDAASKLFVTDIAVSGLGKIGLQSYPNPLAISEGAVAIAEAGLDNLGGVLVGASSSKTITITNNSDVAVSLGGTPKVALTGSTDFTVDSQPAAGDIAAGGTKTFVIKFTPSGTAGARAGAVSIPYTINEADPVTGTLAFAVQGYALVAGGGGDTVQVPVVIALG